MLAYVNLRFTIWDYNLVTDKQTQCGTDDVNETRVAEQIQLELEHEINAAKISCSQINQWKDAQPNWRRCQYIYIWIWINFIATCFQARLLFSCTYAIACLKFEVVRMRANAHPIGCCCSQIISPPPMLFLNTSPHQTRAQHRLWVCCVWWIIASGLCSSVCTSSV